MDWRVRAIEHTAAVPLDGDFAVGVVLRRRTRDGRESAVDAANRRAVHADTVLRDPEDDPVAVRARVRDQRETDPPVDAANGTGGDLSEAAVVGSGARTSDGRGRATDNIFIERLWRTVKYEEVYLKDYLDVLETVANLRKYFVFLQSRTSASSIGLPDASGDLLSMRGMRRREGRKEGMLWVAGIGDRRS